MTSRPRTIIFDLDGVLAGGDSMSSLVRRLLLANPLRLVAAAPLVAALGALKGRPEARGLMARGVVRVALVGTNEERYARAAHRAGQELADTEGWPIAEGVERLREHLAAGEDIVVTTGCEEHLARGYLDGLGLGGVRLIASRYRPQDLPRVIYSHNYGRRKLQGLLAAEVPMSGAVFYTDSVADLPVAAAVASVRLVNPDERIRRAYKRAGVVFEEVRWRLDAHAIKSYNV